MKYILEGNDNTVAKVVRENRIRVARGEISFTLCDEESAEDFIDDDVNGIPDEEDQLPVDDDSFNDEEEGIQNPEVQKIILEPLKSEASAAEETVVTDNKEVTIADDKSVASKVEKPKGKTKKSE